MQGAVLVGELDRATHGPDTLRRLRALKRRYDPANVFRLNQNIAPRPDDPTAKEVDQP